MKTTLAPTTAVLADSIRNQILDSASPPTACALQSLPIVGKERKRAVEATSNDQLRISESRRLQTTLDSGTQSLSGKDLPMRAVHQAKRKDELGQISSEIQAQDDPTTPKPKLSKSEVSPSLPMAFDGSDSSSVSVTKDSMKS